MPSTTRSNRSPRAGLSSSSQPVTSPQEPSIAEASPTSRLPMLPGLDSGISSLASAAGPTHSDSLEYPTTPMSGPGPARVSHSRPQGRGSEFATLDIFGQHGSHSSRSVVLQSSLESRLRAETVSLGSTVFSLTWNDAVTPSGRRICALRASGHRTFDKGSTSLPTPRASMGDHMIAWSRAEKGEHRSQLEDFLAWMWLADGGQRERALNVCPSLCGTIMGYPRSWLDTAMPLCRKSPQRSSAPRLEGARNENR
jgi:hypothetical protein